MTTTAATDLSRRWKHLQEGAGLAAELVTEARDQTLDEVAATIHKMTRRRLEAAAFAMVIVHAEGAPLVDPEDG